MYIGKLPPVRNLFSFIILKSYITVVDTVLTFVMSFHPLEVAFHAQTWEQRVGLIRGNHKEEMENILLSQTSVLEPLKDEDRSYAVVAAFWHPDHTRYPEGVDVKGHIDQYMWETLNDCLSEWNSSSVVRS
jgi:hypothetical protein